VIHLSVIADAEETILNKCHEGAIFWFAPFFVRKNNYRMTAKAREESVVYILLLFSDRL
jgi:CBS domain-containing protein